MELLRKFSHALLPLAEATTIMQTILCNLNALAEAERHYKRDLHVERKFVHEKDFGTEEEDEPVRGERNDEESERGNDQKKYTREEDDWTAQATTIFVANLNWSTKKEDLHILFSPIGKM